MSAFHAGKQSKFTNNLVKVKTVLPKCAQLNGVRLRIAHSPCSHPPLNWQCAQQIRGIWPLEELMHAHFGETACGSYQVKKTVDSGGINKVIGVLHAAYDGKRFSAKSGYSFSSFSRIFGKRLIFHRGFYLQVTSSRFVGRKGQKDL